MNSLCAKPAGGVVPADGALADEVNGGRRRRSGRQLWGLYGGTVFPRRHPASAGKNGNIEAIAIDQMYSR